MMTPRIATASIISISVKPRLSPWAVRSACGSVRRALISVDRGGARVNRTRLRALERRVLRCLALWRRHQRHRIVHKLDQRVGASESRAVKHLNIDLAQVGEGRRRHDRAGPAEIGILARV